MEELTPKQSRILQPFVVGVVVFCIKALLVSCESNTKAEVAAAIMDHEDQEGD